MVISIEMPRVKGPLGGTGARDGYVDRLRQPFEDLLTLAEEVTLEQARGFSYCVELEMKLYMEVGPLKWKNMLSLEVARTGALNRIIQGPPQREMEIISFAIKGEICSSAAWADCIATMCEVNSAAAGVLRAALEVHAEASTMARLTLLIDPTSAIMTEGLHVTRSTLIEETVTHTYKGSLALDDAKA